MYSLITLGRLSLEQDGAPVPGFDVHRKSASILVILATQERVGRDRIMALLWPDSDTEHARGSLTQALHQLRLSLQAFDVVQGSASLQLNPTHITTDVARFSDALIRGDDASAVALYAGPFIDGVHLAGSSELEHLVDASRADLARRWAGAVERLADRAERAGDFQRAAELWRQRYERDPTDGQGAVRLMRALDHSGQRTAALRQATLHQQRLHDEWELPPDPAVANLVDEWLAHQPPRNAQPSGRSPESQPPARPGMHRIRASAFLLWLVGITVALLLLARAATWTTRTPVPARDPALVAVAPFHVVDSSLALWREGLADVLTRDLDGAGPLRTVTGPIPFKHWPGGANRSAADNLGRRTGAGLVVYGSVARLDADTLALRATVLNRDDNTSADLEVRGPVSHMGELSDSLVIGILKLLGHEHPIASARRVSIGARSLPALKEFLRGEQYYRRGMWDSALTNYERAVAQDSTFALALRRLAYVSGWGATSSDSAVNFARLIPRAVALNRGLAPRDSLLLLADSFRTSAPPRDAASLFFNAARALALLEEAARRYPLDPDIWFELAEASHHTPQPVRPATERILEAIDRAIGLDPGFGPAYEHAVELALQLGDQPRAARYARMGAMLAPNTEASAFQLAQLIFDSGVGSPAATLALRQASANTLLGTGADHLRWATDSGEAALVLLRLVAEGTAPQSGADVFVSDPLLRPRHLAWALAFRGHLEAAADVLPARQPVSRALAAILNPFLELALFGAIPDSIAQRVFAGALAPDALWGGTPGRVLPRYLRGAPWWLAWGDTVALARLAERAADVALDSVGVVASRGRYLHGTALAYLALARGDSLRAIRLLRALPDTLCMVVFCFHEKVTLARLLAARADYPEAAGLLDRWGQSGGNTPSAVLAALDRARIAEQLGDTVVAVKQYRFVAAAWRHADVVLQPYVTEASGALSRLSGDIKVPDVHILGHANPIYP